MRKNVGQKLSGSAVVERGATEWGGGAFGINGTVCKRTNATRVEIVRTHSFFSGLLKFTLLHGANYYKRHK